MIWLHAHKYNVGLLLHLQQDVQIKEELTAAKLKMDQINALKEEYQSNLKKKDKEIHILKRIIEEFCQVCQIRYCDIRNPLSLSMMSISH